MPELIKGAVAEAEAFEKQQPSLGTAGEGPVAGAADSGALPLKVQLGKTAQTALQVMPLPCIAMNAQQTLHMLHVDGLHCS